MNIYADPNTGCFSHQWPLLGMRNVTPKKLKNNFSQDKFYSLKAHAHYFTAFIYLATWKATKFGIFTYFMFINLPRCSQSMNSLICVYSIQIPSIEFSWVLDSSQSWSHFFVLPLPKAIFCITSRDPIRASHNANFLGKAIFKFYN